MLNRSSVFSQLCGQELPPVDLPTGHNLCANSGQMMTWGTSITGRQEFRKYTQSYADSAQGSIGAGDKMYIPSSGIY